MQYLTYDDYIAMGGELDEISFSSYEIEAESVINWYTFNRLVSDTEFSDKVKRLMCRLIYLIQLNRNAMSSGINSKDTSTSTETSALGSIITQQSNDGYSTTYSTLSATDAISSTSLMSDNVKSIIMTYLQGEVNSLGRHLLYRGVYPDE